MAAEANDMTPRVLLMVCGGILSVFVAAILTSLALGLPNEPGAAAQEDNGDDLDSFTICIVKFLGDDAGDAGVLETDFAVDFTIGDESAERVPFVQTGVEGCGGDFTAELIVPSNSDEGPPEITATEVVLDETTPARFVRVEQCNATDVALPTVTFDLSDEGPYVCAFVNDTVPVCVYKSIGAGLNLSGLADQETVPWSFDVQSQGGSVPVVEVATCGEAGGPGFYVAPGAEFTISETIDPEFAGQIGLVSASCTAYPGEGASETVEADENGVVTMTAPTDPDFTDVACDFENDSVLVCVDKSSDADPFDFAPLFSATADGETVASHILLQEASDDDPCGYEGGQTFSFYTAPDSAVIITESLPFGSPVGLIAAECSTRPLFADGDNGDLEPVELETTLDGPTVSFTVGDSGVAYCELQNAYLQLCLTKTLGAGAVAVGHDAADFGFDVTFGEATAPPVDVGGCDGSEDPTAVTTAYAVAPGSTVTVQETGPGEGGSQLAYAPVEIACSNEAEGDLASQSVTFDAGIDRSIDCWFENDTLIVCVVKEVNPTAVDAGFTADMATFTVVDGETTIEPFDTGCDGDESDTEASYAYALVPDPEQTDTFSITEDANELDAHVGLVLARCFPGLNVSTSDLETRTIVSPKSHGGNSILRCEFVNDSVEVTITKTLVLDDGREASIGDFLFDVFDADGAAIESGLATGATFYVAPGSTFTITERSAIGFTATGTCTDREIRDQQALAGAASVTHTPGEFVEGVDCTFVNDDIAPIPVCAMLILDEGSTGFTLDDFTLELYEDGGLIGERNAGDPFDPACEDTSDSTADLLPGALVQLGSVFADGSTFAFVATVSDPSGLIEFEPSSCSTGPAAAQALKTSDPVMFTAEPGTTLVTCVAQAAARVVTGGGGLIPGGQPILAAPVAPAAAPPEPEPAQALPVAVGAIAVTGSSTSGTTLPIALGLLSAGFLGLGLGRRRRQRTLDD